jgi:DtxR family Mn-dependent transcriptional regulator
MTELKEIGVVPGETIHVSPIGDRAGTVEVRGAGDAARIQTAVAHAVLAHAR